MHKTKFIDESGVSHPEFERIIAELVEMDFIETENEEQIFYLTTSGYDFVEELIGKQRGKTHKREVIQIDQSTELIRKFGTKKFKKFIVFWLISFGFFVAVHRFYFPNSLKSNEAQIEVIITDERVNEIKKQVKVKLDSINN